MLAVGCAGEQPERDTASATTTTPSAAATSREPVVPLDPVAQECVQEVMEVLELSWRGKADHGRPDAEGQAKVEAFNKENATTPRHLVFSKNLMLGSGWIAMATSDGQSEDEAIQETVTDIREYVETDCVSADE
ncbi:hypothetical protein [Streptomyces pini]|uniref:Lipoprotein n=1 Tax=Streptomyces pini TaxID=1520580 RepID=A0A1I3UHU4_9ACTN|nr:hypothetical protein [Streptomyces pini]SFJ82435.1 hypothetical protein SAMN05192584_101501 [Streptomyces pini]